MFSVAIALRATELAQAGGLPLCDVAFDCGCGSGVENACSKLRHNAGLLALSVVALVSRSRRWCLRKELLPGPR